MKDKDNQKPVPKDAAKEKPKAEESQPHHHHHHDDDDDDNCTSPRGCC